MLAPPRQAHVRSSDMWAKCFPWCLTPLSACFSHKASSGSRCLRSQFHLRKSPPPPPCKQYPQRLNRIQRRVYGMKNVYPIKWHCNNIIPKPWRYFNKITRSAGRKESPVLWNTAMNAASTALPVADVGEHSISVIIKYENTKRFE